MTGALPDVGRPWHITQPHTSIRAHLLHRRWIDTGRGRPSLCGERAKRWHPAAVADRSVSDCPVCTTALLAMHPEISRQLAPRPVDHRPLRDYARSSRSAS